MKQEYPDIELFENIKRNNLKSFEDLYFRYSKELFGFALGFIKNKEDAEDIVQDVYIYLWKNRHNIDIKTTVYGYLLNSIKNICLNKKKHISVKRKYENFVINNNLDKINPIEEIDSIHKLQDDVYKSINKLPEKCKEIFLKSCIDGMKYKEIANEMGISENTVKTQIKIAYRKIRLDNDISMDKLLLIIIIIKLYSP